MIEQTLVHLITTDSQLAPAIGDRVRPQQARPDDALPLIVYDSDGGEDPSPTLSGPSGWLIADIEVAVAAATYVEAQTLGRRVRQVLDAFRGAAPNGCLVSYIACQTEGDDEQEQEGADPIHLRVMTFRSLFRPPT